MANPHHTQQINPSTNPERTTTPTPYHQKNHRRRRQQYTDPFPIFQTTETPPLSTSDLIALEEKNNLEPTITLFPHLTPPRHHIPTSTPKSSTPLRPVQDILNRLIWDPWLQQSRNDDDNEVEAEEKKKKKKPSYVIGYLDRFTGPQEIGFDEWMERRRDLDGEQWIPLHRVLWVKRKGVGAAVEKMMDSLETDDDTVRQDGTEEEEDVVVIWDRQQRIDRVFCSGNHD